MLTHRVLLGVSFLTLATSFASAAPPASCAYKFVGTWVYPGGTTVIAPGGVSYPKCAMCVPTQTWTCQGNTYLFSNSGPPGQFSATLSADGRQLIGGGVVATRVGGAAQGGNTAKKAPTPDAKQNPRDKKNDTAQKTQSVKSAKAPDTSTQAGVPNAQHPPAPEAAPRKSASCSDITGTSSTAPAASYCRDADRALYAARQIRKADPQVAATEYKKAAAAARRAGDNTLELSILREAMEPVTAALASPAPSDSPASAAEAPIQPPAGAVPRLWDGTRETCETANNLEKHTAGWYVMCSDAPPPVMPATAHRPDPDPRELSKLARAACGSYSRETQQCFSEVKLKEILARNPGLQEICEAKAAQGSLRRQLAERLNTRLDNRERFLECVDNVYLYGSTDGPPLPKNALRETLRKRLAETSSTEPQPSSANNAAPRSCWSPGRCCQPGWGLKPTPGAFGAWSCQPLGPLLFDATQPRLPPKDEADLIEDFEDRMNETVANAVAAALEAFGAAMSESDRDVCAAASFAAVHAMARGGAPAVPEQCRAMASGARAYFTSHARAHVNNRNGAMEDLLTSFAGDLGAPLPGMTGLTPDETLRRAGECLRGERSEACN
jgi:hypothetical protein